MAAKDDIPAHFRDWNGSEGSPDTMEKPSTSTKPLWKRPWVLAVAAAATVAVLIAIIVPLAVLLPKKKGKANHSVIILPLYIYPTNSSSWQPLYDSLDAQKDRQFLLIINPSSGPGNATKPDEQYSSELIKLTAYSNVELVGYVRTGYASRNLSDVTSEVSTYGEWASSNMSFAMSGIFFDESPHQYSAEAVEFMRKATQHVKDTGGLQGQKTVIRNPGVIPDAAFDDSNTDISVVFEQSYGEYQSKKGELGALKTSDRSGFCYMVHSVPSMAKDGLGKFVGELSKHAKYLFVTTNAENYYEKFGSDWAEFTDVVPK